MYEKVETCPVCSGTQLKNYYICEDHLLTRESFAVMQCLTCGLLITTPRPDQQSIGSYYNTKQYLSHHSSTTMLGRIYAIAQSYTLWSKYRLIKKLAPREQRLLDYGSGSGIFLEYMTNKQWAVAGVEPIETARTQAIENGLLIYPDIASTKETEKKFSVITLWHVLEHVHDLNTTIKQLKKLLQKNGYLVIALPNIKSWDALYYKENWAAFDVPRHLYHFPEESLVRLMKNLQLSYQEKHPMYLDAFYISLLSEKYKNGKNSYIIPFIKGCLSNIYGLKAGEFSSMIYIFQKK